MTVQFKEPPPKKQRAGASSAVRVALREMAEKPGQWALLEEGASPSRAEQAKAYAHDVGVHIEVRRVSTGDGHRCYDIYARVLEKAPWFDNGASS